ncbi:MAG: M55 family metallopeptidase [Pseudomonadota bacterium]
MRLYISADIEGIAGVVSTAQTLEDGFEYERACRWMTEEVLAACRGAMDAGVTEVVVSDSHGNGQNLLLDLLPDGVELIRHWPRPWAMMQGIEHGTYDMAMLIGHHGGAQHHPATLAHTFAGRMITQVRVNNAVASETTVNAAIAANFGVPVVLASGDQAYVQHVKELLPDVLTVVTKEAHGRYSARTRTPAAVCRELTEKAGEAAAAVSSGRSFRPFMLEEPVTLEIDFQQHAVPELLELLPQVERNHALGIHFEARSVEELSRFLSFVIALGPLQ